MVIYMDVVFLVNLFIDGAVLSVTAWMRKQQVSWWRLLLSSVLGALYVIMIFVPELSFLFTFLIKFMLSVIMLLVAFGFGSLQRYLRTMGMFYVVNFVAAGGIWGTHFLLQNAGEVFNGIWYTASGGLSYELKMSFWFLLIVFGMVLLLFRMVHASRQRTADITEFIGKVRVRIEDHHVECMGLLDTGNQLTDPLTRTPVMVMEASLWKEFLPPSWEKRLGVGQAEALLLELDETAFAWRDRIRLVPYRGINNTTSFMIALKPDEVQIQINGMLFVKRKALIGLDGGNLSSEGRYRAIIHPDMIGEGEEHIHSCIQEEMA